MNQKSQLDRLYRGRPIATGNPYLDVSVADMGATLVLTWLDESPMRVPARLLRERCLCETCRGKRGNFC